LTASLESPEPPGRTEERDALEALCDVLLRQGDDAALDRALGRLAEARDDSASRSRALSLQGAARARLGLTAEAAESYRAALQLEPNDAQALAGLAEAAYALRLWDEARAALEPLHHRGLPPRVERALRLGELAQRHGTAADAIGFYQSALEAGASGADAIRAWNALISLYHARADHDAEARAQLSSADDERLNETATARASRLVAAAEILRKRLGRVAEARAQYDRALTLDPLHLAALDALEAIAETEGDVEACEQVLSRKVAATARRPQQQKAILGRLAKLQAERLGRPDAARQAYERALAIDPDFRPALAFLAAEARDKGDAVEEQRYLLRLVTLPPDPIIEDARPGELVRLAQLLHAAGRPEDAEAAVRRALEAQPRHPRGLALLDELYTKAGRSEELIPILAMRAEVETDYAHTVELLFRRAALLETHGRRAEAVAAYEQLTSIKPASTTGWNRLAALLREEQAWPRLAEVLLRLGERHAAEGRREEAEAVFVEVAHLCHDRLADAARGQAVLERALEINPRSRVALSGLIALARARGDAADEDALLGRMAEVEEDLSARAQVITERARVRQARGDLMGALALLGDLDLGVSPEAALRLRVEIAEARGVPAEATQALEALRLRARGARDFAGERWAVRRLAHLATAHGPTRAAEELFRRALELDPDDREAARALADIERGRGDDLAYLDTLDRLLRTARRTFEGGAREAELCVEMAEVLRRNGDLDGAQAKLREALEAAPEDGRAWRLYGAVLLDSGAHPEAARALRRAAELGVLEPTGFVELAQIHEVLGDAQLAADAYARAGEAAPPASRAEALERIGHDDEALEIWRSLAGREARRRAALVARRRAERAFATGRLD
jgi:tetratricopeptide (TPR) repeat protein